VSLSVGEVFEPPAHGLGSADAE
jgi:hypothetical protein